MIDIIRRDARALVTSSRGAEILGQENQGHVTVPLAVGTCPQIVGIRTVLLEFPGEMDTGLTNPFPNANYLGKH